MKVTKILVVVIGGLMAFSSARADWRYQCTEATQQLSGAQTGLQQATLILGQVGQICGGAIACIITAQTAYNNAVQAVQAAQSEKDWACGCQDAIERSNGAQAALNQALAVLLNVNNICGGAPACIVTAQTAYVQAKSNLDSAQAEQNRMCHQRGDGWRHRRGGP